MAFKRATLHESLREIYRASDGKTILLIIPGITATRQTELLSANNGFWRRTIPLMFNSNVSIFFFDHGLAADESFTWNDVFNQGEVLLEALRQLRQFDEFCDSTILFSSYSLGGIILKRAIGLAYQQLAYFKELLVRIIGTMFFSTPHSISVNPREWHNASLILKFAPNSRLRGRESVTQDIAEKLADACKRFELACERFPVFSAYETQETKVSGRIGSSKFLLVGRQYATVNAQQHDLHALNNDHIQMCSMRVANADIPTLTSFVTRAMNALDIPPSQISSDSKLFTRPLSMLGDNSFRHAANESISPGGRFTVFSDPASERRDPCLPCHLMPLSRNKDFFGRVDILEELDEYISPNQSLSRTRNNETSTPRAFAICGAGGLGKTQIAAEYAHSRKSQYDAIFWVQADELAKLTQGFYNIAIRLGLVEENSVDARDHNITREVVKAWMKNPLKSYTQARSPTPELAKWLLIFDNLDNHDILKDFFPWDSEGSVLITSHDPLAKTHIASTGRMLPPFNAEEATQFLMKLTKRDQDHEIEEEISSGNAVAARLGGLPLAITQMAGVIARRDLSFSEFLQVYDEESSHKELFESRINPMNQRSGYQHTLASVWALETLSKSAVLLNVLSLLDSDGIQERILEKKGVETLLPGYPNTTAAYQIARTELLQSSLITRDRSTKTITMHRLIQDAARTKMLPEQFQTTFNATVDLLSSVWPYEQFDWRHFVGSRTQCEDLFPHVIRLRNLSERLPKSTTVYKTDLQFPRLLTDAGWFNHEVGNALESEPFFNLAHKICEDLQQRLANTPPEDIEAQLLNDELNLLLAQINYNIGCISTETNKPQAALTHFKAFNEMMVKKYALDSANEIVKKKLAISWNELGNALMMNKRWHEGIDCFLKSVDTLRKLGFPETEICFPFANLGFAYWILEDFDKAEKVCEEALQTRQDAFGYDDGASFITGKLLHALGNIKASQNCMDESFDLHNRALKQYKKFTVGKNSHRTADVCIKVADHHVRLKEYSLARTLINQALKIYGGQDSYAPERARASFKKANLLTAMGEAKPAEDFFQQAYALYRTVNPGDRRNSDELCDKDFDDTLTFWSR